MQLQPHFSSFATWIAAEGWNSGEVTQIASKRAKSICVREFVQTVVTFCLLGKMEILKFCFFVLDKRKEGKLTDLEYIEFLKQLYPDEPPQMKRAIAVMRE